MQGAVMNVGGTDIYYVEKGEGLPVVLVHGNTGSCRWFERVMDIPGCRTVALDLPNFGRSGPLPGAPAIDGYADFVARFIEALGLQEPLLVGHSLGGSIATSLAVRHPRLPRALVLVDSAAPSGLVTPAERHPVIEMMRTNKAVLARALAAVVPTLKDEAFLAALVDDAAVMAAPAWIGNVLTLNTFNCTALCANFKGPVLVIWGRKDAILTEEMARETVTAFPRASLRILEGVGHSVMVEDPAEFVRIISAFIAKEQL
jgi:branched-chain amino acid transport system permease protein